MDSLSPLNMRIFTEREFVEYASRGMLAGTIVDADFNAEYEFGNCKVEETPGCIRIVARGNQLGCPPCHIEVTVTPQFDSRLVESVCSKHGTEACPAVMALMCLTTKDEFDDFDRDICDSDCRRL